MQGRYRNGIPEDDRRMLLGCAFGGAIVVAPFVALLYSRAIALIVLALALASIVFLVAETSRQTVGDQRRALQILLAVNAAFLALTIAALFWMVAE